MIPIPTPVLPPPSLLLLLLLLFLVPPLVVEGCEVFLLQKERYSLRRVFIQQTRIVRDTGMGGGVGGEG